MTCESAGQHSVSLCVDSCYSDNAVTNAAQLLTC
jgi:hypothetical protein